MVRHVLVVDDHPAVLDALRIVLEDAGYCVATASDGPQALETVSRCAPDVIITDLQMPEMPGWELCHHLRALGSTTPNIFMSASASVAALAAANGADGWLAKPFEIDELLGLLVAVARPAAA